MKKKMNTTYMVELAVLIAIILIMAFTPIGYIRTLGLEITLIVVPVAVGAVTLGPMAGLILGTIFGITQFYPVLRHERFRRHAALHQSGVYLYRLRSHENADGMADRTDFPGTSEGIRYEKIACPVSCLASPLLNTLFFHGCDLHPVFTRQTTSSRLATSFGASNALAFVIAFVGFNGLVRLWLPHRRNRHRPGSAGCHAAQCEITANAKNET